MTFRHSVYNDYLWRITRREFRGNCQHFIILPIIKKMVDQINTQESQNMPFRLSSWSVTHLSFSLWRQSVANIISKLKKHITQTKQTLFRLLSYTVTLLSFSLRLIICGGRIDKVRNTRSISIISRRPRRSHSVCHHWLWLICHSVYDDNLWQTSLANSRAI